MVDTPQCGINGDWAGVVGPFIARALIHRRLESLAVEDPLYKQVVSELTERFEGDEDRQDLWLVRRHDLLGERPCHMLGIEPQRFLDALAYDREQPVDRIVQLSVAMQYAGKLVEHYDFADPERNVNKEIRQQKRISNLIQEVFGDDQEAECDWFHEVGIPLLDQKDYRSCLRALKALRNANRDLNPV